MRRVEITIERKRTHQYQTATARYGIEAELAEGEDAQAVFEEWTPRLKALAATAYAKEKDNGG